MSKYSAVNDPVLVAKLLRRYVNATKSWELSTKEHAALLDVPTATWSRIINGSYRGRLSQDKVTRIFLVEAIKTAIIEAHFPPNWLSCYNALQEYNGEPPLKKVFDGGIIEMFEVLKALIKEGQRL